MFGWLNWGGWREDGKGEEWMDGGVSTAVSCGPCELFRNVNELRQNEKRSNRVRGCALV